MKIEEAQAQAREIEEAAQHLNLLIRKSPLQVELNLNTFVALGDRNTPMVQVTCTVDPKQLEI
tara:strand:+ start:123 stop:311 length:189 start_codon:yes stop_codon:yes gene_type:complete